MEENHHQEQQHQQPKFNNGVAGSFNYHHYFQQPPPFPFQQGFPPVATTPPGFSQFAHNNSNNQFPPFHPLQPPPPQQRRPIHQDQESVSCSTTSAFIPPSPAVLSFPRDSDGKNGGFCSGGGGGGGRGDGLLRGGLALDTRREAGNSHYGGWENLEDSPAITIRQPLREPISDTIGNEKGANDMKDKEMEQQPSDQLNGNKFFGELQELCRTATAVAASANKVSTNRDDGGLVEAFAAAAKTTTTAAPNLPPTKTNEDTNGGGDELPSRTVDAADDEKIRDDEMNSMAVFFEGLVYRLMEHQENIHKKFMAAIDKLDQERKERERVWRQKELERLEQEAALRANERALASQREASIVSYLEKITGQSIELPSSLIEPEETRTRSGMGMRVSSVNELSSRGSRGGGDDLGSLRLMKNRWPPVEVDALIQLRMSLEKKFQGPGYKGPLWEEISKMMGSMGYHRTAKRCKEKWENINKYFKKYKENHSSSSSNPKFRKKMNKTCRYFDQLDQLYSKSSGLLIYGGSNSCSSSSEHHQQRQGNINPFSSSNGNGVLVKQNEAFVSPGDRMKAGGPTIEEVKQGSIIQRIDEGQHPMNYSVEEMEEDEEVEERHGNGNGNDALLD
ncbi:OLC1v1031959C1 [Oldenlandia corymbosa var. corymbosa]|uniref:OLC1v1031959C1 n=1 Tax=Oldenlandia corymbosa var. corymbosa TaxID=529605 RepID=A0AAV1CJT6_OLDCO|nr:OLC1v1031959C1 [Oldenlandia corymbosa var. corymbosa]